MYTRVVTAPFNNMRTLKFKARPTNAFFATANQMFGGSSRPPTTAEREVITSFSTDQTTKQCSAVVGSWEEPPNISLTVAKNAFVGRALTFRVRMLSKGAVKALLAPKITLVMLGSRLDSWNLKTACQ